MRELGFAIVVPNFAAGSRIEFVHPATELDVEHAEHRFECGGVRWGFGDEVVVIREDSPSFEIPTVFGCDGEKTTLKNFEALRTAKVMRFEVSRRRDEVGATFGESMSRCGGACGQSMVLGMAGSVENRQGFRKSRCVLECGGPPPLWRGLGGAEIGLMDLGSLGLR